MVFREKLEQIWQSSNSLLCVGLDPELKSIPEGLRSDKQPLLSFCCRIVDCTADLVCAFKPQAAYFAAAAAERELEQLIAYIHERHPSILVILDGKRSDIGSTAERYAVEVFERYRADAVTVNPYLGSDGIEPFTRYADRGVFILCRTSNPSAPELQDLMVDNRRIFEHVAMRAVKYWDSNRNAALVVGATYPAEVGIVRSIVGDMPLLIPGIGAQGGDVALTLSKGKTSTGTGLLINSSRGILYAGSGDDFESAARSAAKKLRDEINLSR